MFKTEIWLTMGKRLLFITPIFPKDASEDAVVPFIFQFTKEFSSTTDVKIDVISLMYPFSKKPYSIGNIAVYPMGSRFRKSAAKIPFLLKAIYTGIRLARKNEYDGVLCFWYRESALVGKIISRLFKKKQTVWMLGQDINKDNAYIRLLKIPDENLILMSQQQSQFFHQNHQIKIDKIANVAVTRNLFPQLNTGARTIDVLGVGNLGSLKNYSLFIEILSEIKVKNLKAVIIGNGEELEALEAKAIQLGLENNVQFAGAMSHNEVLDYMNNAKVFLHTSKSEGGGTVLQEALFSGCKLVSTIDVEHSQTLESFYFGTDKNALAEKVSLFLENSQPAKRVELFKMEETISVIYDSFYKD